MNVDTNMTNKLGDTNMENNTVAVHSVKSISDALISELNLSVLSKDEEQAQEVFKNACSQTSLWGYRDAEILKKLLAKLSINAGRLERAGQITKDALYQTVEAAIQANHVGAAVAQVITGIQEEQEDTFDE